jgi:DNA-directed RNA polymerase, mitochondrial
VEIDRESRQRSIEQQRQQPSILTIEATATTEASRAYPGVAALMGSYFDAMVLQLRDFFTAEARRPNRRHTLYTLLQRASPESIAHVTLRQIVRGLTGYERNGQKNTANGGDDKSTIFHTNVAIKIGRALAQLQLDREQQVSSKTWTDRDSVKVGAKCLSLLENSTANPLFRRKTIVTGDRRQVSVLELSPHALDWFSFMVERGAFAKDLPTYKPMVCPPKPWTTPTDGGYLTLRTPLVKVYGEKGRAYLADLKSTKMPFVYRALNALQAVPFVINKKVLEVAQKLSGGGVGCVPDEKRITALKQLIEETKTKALSKRESKEAKKLWREHYQLRGEYATLVGRKIQADTIKSLASEFAQEQEMFFPMNLDFRGRVNPLPVFLNPNGNDLAKSLLMFAEGKQLFDVTDERQLASEDFWLASYGAGLYKAKDCGKSVPDKWEWVRVHRDQIFHCATDPLNALWWTQASEPWRFLAFCFEYHAFWTNPDGLCHLPIAVDGTCNGLQHYALMLRSEHIAEAVNLKPSRLPQDLYQRVADRMKSQFAMPDAPKLAKEWLALGFDREATKKIVMANPYGISRLTERQHVRKYLAGLPSCPWKLKTRRRREAINFFAQAVHDALAIEVEAAAYAMSWLKSAARILSNNGLAIKWRSPAGLPIVQNYTEVDSYQIEVMLEDGKRYQPRLTKETNRLDADKQCKGIAPNFIHSLDAAHLMLTINRALDDGITTFSTNHDCYSVLAQDHYALFDGIRQAMIDCHQEPALEAFFQEAAANLTPEQRRKILPLPSLGQLKLEEVREAFFAFTS